MVTTPDAVLVLNSKEADKVKALVEALRHEKRREIVEHRRTEAALRIASYNVHYIRLDKETGAWSVGDWERRKGPLDSAFKALRADVVAFQEMESFQRGDLFEVVPGQTFFERCESKPSEISRRLKPINPSPYSFFINLGNQEYLVGASPEMFVRVNGRRIETCPISGTIKRGEDAISDSDIEAGKYDGAAVEQWLVNWAEPDEAGLLAGVRQSLRGLPDLPWQLLVAGDGPARREVEQAFQAFTGSHNRRVFFLGEQRPEQVPGLLAAADVSVWPAVGEAYGMALLESQAAGTPVVAGKLPGVAAIVDEGRSGILTKPGDSATFAAAIRAILSAPALRRQMSQSAAQHVAERHSLPAAAARLTQILEEAVGS